jgi:quinoprotein glucose dehydrogenase
LPKPFAKQTFTVNDLNRITTESAEQAQLKQRFLLYRAGSIFTPPSLRGTPILPGYDGGEEWGGPSVDPVTNVLYVNANEMAWVLNMVENKKKTAKVQTILQAGIQGYKQYCRNCHGTTMKRNGNFPAIADAGKKYDKQSFVQLLTTCRKMMPGFNQLNAAQKNVIAAYVLNLKEEHQLVTHHVCITRD